VTANRCDFVTDDLVDELMFVGDAARPEAMKPMSGCLTRWVHEFVGGSG